MFFKKRRIYFDWASAAPLDAAVARELARAAAAYPGNPSAPHAEGRAAYAALAEARRQIAETLAVKPDELTFASGGTEANALALRGLVNGLRERGLAASSLHIVTSAIEHSSVLATLAALEREGVSVTRLMPRPSGIVEAEDVLRALKPETVLVTLAHVNSELGTITPLPAIGDLLRKREQKPDPLLQKACPEAAFPILHADAAQSLLYLDASPHVLRSTLVSYDAQKIGGPKGVGVLYRDASVPLAPVLRGGSQERGLRPGTENVPSIVAAAYAFRRVKEGRALRAERVGRVRSYLVEKVLAAVPEARLLGDRTRRTAGIADFAIPGIDGDYLAVLMDREGVAVTPRSACIGSGGERSEVVYALTGDDSLSRGTIRFSLGPDATLSDADGAVYALRQSLATLRKL